MNRLIRAASAFIQEWKRLPEPSMVDFDLNDPPTGWKVFREQAA